MKTLAFFTSCNIKMIMLLTIAIAFSVPGLSQADSAQTIRLVIDNHSFLLKSKVPLSGYSYNDPMINSSINETIRYHRKCDNKLAVGLIFSAVGVLITGAALLQDLDSSGPDDGGDWNTSAGFGPAPSAVSGILIGTSIPFFIASISNKKKMETSMAETKRLLMH